MSRNGGGCSTATTVPGTLRRGCSGSRAPAIGPVCLPVLPTRSARVRLRPIERRFVGSPLRIVRVSTLSSEAVELAPDALDRAVPIAERWLPEQSRGRIPRGALARERPAPVGRERQQDPYRPPHRTRKMPDRGIDADDEIDESDHGRRVGEIVELRADLHHARFARQQLGVFAAQFALNADEPWRGGRPQRTKALERDLPIAIAYILRDSAPSERDPPPLDVPDARAPFHE